MQVFGFCMIHVLCTWISVERTIAQESLATRVIEGIVTNLDGKPIKGASIEWGHFQATKDGREVFRTDAEGKYRVETKKVGPDFRIGVSAAGFAPVWKDGVIPPKVDAGKPLKIDFTLPAPVALRGRLVDRNGVPIAGVSVIAQSPSSRFASSFWMPIPAFPFPGPLRESTTNANGEFLIRYLPATSVAENAQEKGYEFDVSIKTESGVMPCGVAFSEIENQIAVDRSNLEAPSELEGMIRGRVLDAVTKKPIENFRVVRRFVPTMNEITHAQGEFLLDKLKVGRSVQFFVYAKDYAPFVLSTTTDDGRAIVECELHRKPSLKGMVVDSNGKPIAGAEVVLGFDEPGRQSKGFYWDAFKTIVDGYMGLNYVQRQTTDDDGRFEFGLVDQHAVVAVMKPGFTRQVRFYGASDLEALSQSDLRMALEPESVLAGFVKMNGIPIAKANLQLSNTQNWELNFGAIETDKEGRFAVHELPSGTYRLCWYEHIGPMSAARLCRNIVLQENEHKSDLVLDNPGGNSSLRGKADPFAFVSLVPTTLDGELEIEYSHMGTFSDPEGEFEIRGLHPGSYRCSIGRTVSSLQGFSVPANSQEILVRGESVLNPSKN